jgi:hypothetical protein
MKMGDLLEILLGAGIGLFGFLYTVFGRYGDLGQFFEFVAFAGRWLVRRPFRKPLPRRDWGNQVSLEMNQILIERPEFPGRPSWSCSVGLRPAVLGVRPSRIDPETTPFEGIFSFRGDPMARAHLARNRDRLRPMLSFVRRFKHVLTGLHCSERCIKARFVDDTCISAYFPEQRIRLGFVKGDMSAPRAVVGEMLALADAFFSTFLLPPLAENPPHLSGEGFFVESDKRRPEGPYSAEFLAARVRNRQISVAAVIIGPAGERSPLALHPEFAPLFDWNLTPLSLPEPEPQPVGSMSKVLLPLAQRPFVPLGIALIVLGFILGTHGIARVRHRHEVEILGRPTAPGKVVASDVRTKCDDDLNCWKAAEIRYVFRLGPTRFEGTHVGYLDDDSRGVDESSERNHAEVLVRRFPPGKEVVVHYRPDRPTDAVVEPGPPQDLKVSWGLSVVFFLSMVVVLSTGGLALYFRLGRFYPPILV